VHVDHYIHFCPPSAAVIRTALEGLLADWTAAA
jgi:coenzyme F420-reducing hydrogenase gamma subunit